MPASLLSSSGTYGGAQRAPSTPPRGFFGDRAVPGQADQAAAVAGSKPHREPLIDLWSGGRWGQSVTSLQRTVIRWSSDGSPRPSLEAAGLGRCQGAPWVSAGPFSPPPHPDPTSLLQLLLKTIPPPCGTRPRPSRNLSQGNRQKQL